MEYTNGRNSSILRRTARQIRRFWPRGRSISKSNGAFSGDETQTLLEELTARDRLLAERDKAVQYLREQIAQLQGIVANRDEGIQFLRMELARLSPEPQEQRDWWDTQFAHAWDQNAGPAQSCHFMQCLVANLQPRERQFLSSRRLRVLDWGCATGDGLNEFVKAFPSCDAFGIDLSRVAIAKAQLKYPGLTFNTTDRGTFQDCFDVIVTSNCLEHFDAPLEWLERLLQASNWLVIVLVPYREEHLIEGHKVSFCEDSFPEVFRGFTRLRTDVIQVDRQFWGGKQLLVVYSSKRYGQEFPGAAAAAG